MSNLRTITSFILVGGFAAVVNVGARYLISFLTSYEIAIVLAYIIAMISAFYLNKIFVFSESDPDWRTQFVKFIMVNALALVQVFVVSLILARFLFPFFGFSLYPEAVAHAIGVASPVLTSYFLHKNFSFAPARVAP